MSYKIAKNKILQALKEGSYQHEVRRGIDTKNLLAIGQVTALEVSQLIASSDGTMHQETPHHTIKDLMVHVIKVRNWYIKFYFLEPDAWFISVHRQNRG